MRVLWVLALCIAPMTATAAVFDLGGSAPLTASATMPGCSDSDNGGGSSQATASCAAGGYAAAASAQASRTASVEGGEVFAFAEAAATSIGPPGTQQASGNASGSANNSWTVTTDTWYSLAVESSGGATAEFTDDVSGPFPPSGVLTPDTYVLRAVASANATAQDSSGAQTVTAGPQEGSASVVFAEVGSPDLIRGTITAGGSAVPGVRVEARDGGVVVKVAFTGNDGSYLLDDLPGTVTLHVSHPLGGFVPLVSAPLTPPTTFDADLAAHAVPALSPFAQWGLLATLLIVAGWRTRNVRRRTPR